MAKWNPFSKKSPGGGTDVTAQPASDDAPQAADHAGDGPPSPTPDSPPSPTPPESTAPAASGGLLGRFKQALKKTVSVLNTDIRDLVGAEGRLVDDEFLGELYAHLIKTDMGAGPASRIRDAVHDQYRNRKVTMHDLVEAAKEPISEIMAQEDADVQLATQPPTVIMVVGVNGSGKTTSIAKLAYLFQHQGKSVVLGAGDTFRAAAVEQLNIWSQRLGVDFVSGRSNDHPKTVAYRAAARAKEIGADVCIIDTAGRLQTQKNLMDELASIRGTIGKVIEGAPHEVLLVLDATAGQNAISQAKGFSAAADCTGIVLAKLDGTAKGGVAIPIRQEFGLPVKFVGLGETPDALAPFDVQRYINALFDLQDPQA